MASNEDLMQAIQTMDARILSMDAKLDNHIFVEQPALKSAQTLIDEHGTKEEVISRIQFINGWMEREKDRHELRKAVIKHGAVVATMTVLYFILKAVWANILQILLSGK